MITFQVAWIFVETQTILTIHHTIITKNPRFTLARNDHKHWYLQISDVRPSDRGMYMCQVNSDPMMSQVGFLDVQGMNIFSFPRSRSLSIYKLIFTSENTMKVAIHFTN